VHDGCFAYQVSLRWANPRFNDTAGWPLDEVCPAAQQRGELLRLFTDWQVC
jgi:hypothetical protein